MLAAYGLRGARGDSSADDAVGHVAVHLVRADLEEALVPVAPRGLEQHERADDLGLHEGVRRLDAAIDVRLGGKVDDRVRLAGDSLDQRRIGDVPMHEAVPRVGGHIGQVLEVAGVGQLVQHGDLQVGMALEHPTHECGADEARSSGDDQPLIPRIADRSMAARRRIHVLGFHIVLVAGLGRACSAAMLGATNDAG